MNFVECESFFESNRPNILNLCETKLDDSIASSNFSVRGYFPLLLICMVLQFIYRFLLMFSAGFTSLTVLVLFTLSIIFFVFMHGF